jgi:integrase
MGDDTEAGPATLSGLRDLTYKLKWIDGRSSKTSLLNADICIKTLGDISPAKVSTQAIDAAVFQWMDEGKSNATINRRLSALSTMLRIAQERGYIKAMPKFPRRKESKGRTRFLSVEEEKGLLEWFRSTKNEDMEDLVILALDLGGRRNELLQIEGRDVTEDSVTLWEVKVNGVFRTQPLSPRAKEVLKRRVERYGMGKLFPDLTRDKVRYAWDMAREHLGLLNDDQFVFHALRHTFCSRLAQAGVDISMIMELAGHTNISTTIRYRHLIPKNKHEAIKNLEAFSIPT